MVAVELAGTKVQFADKIIEALRKKPVIKGKEYVLNPEHDVLKVKLMCLWTLCKRTEDDEEFDRIKKKKAAEKIGLRQ